MQFIVKAECLWLEKEIVLKKTALFHFGRLNSKEIQYQYPSNAVCQNKRQARTVRAEVMDNKSQGTNRKVDVLNTSNLEP